MVNYHLVNSSICYVGCIVSRLRIICSWKRRSIRRLSGATAHIDSNGAACPSSYRTRCAIAPTTSNWPTPNSPTRHRCPTKSPPTATRPVNYQTKFQTTTIKTTLVILATVWIYTERTVLRVICQTTASLPHRMVAKSYRTTTTSEPARTR